VAIYFVKLVDAKISSA